MTKFLQSLLEKMPVTTGDEAAERAQQNIEKLASMSDNDVHAKLDRAAEIDDVDTVVFGMETDTGAVVKVYVRADQADDFEAALANELAENDDIDEVLAELDKEYDIVDVEWPEGYDDENEEDEDEESDPSDEDAEDTMTDGSESLNKAVDRSDTSESYSAKLGLKTKFLGESEESFKARFRESKDDVEDDNQFTKASDGSPKFGALDDDIDSSVSAMDPDRTRLDKYIGSNRYRKLGVDVATKLGITPTMLVRYQSLVHIIGEHVKELNQHQRYYLLKFLGHDSFSDYSIHESQGEVQMANDSVSIKADGVDLQFTHDEIAQIRQAMETGETVEMNVDGASTCTITPTGDGITLKCNTTGWSATLDGELVNQLLDSDGRTGEEDAL